MQRTLDVAVANDLAETAKVLLDVIGRHRIGATAGSHTAAEMTRAYGRLRQIREYLRRESANEGTHVLLEFDRPDMDMLCLSALWAISDADLEDQAEFAWAERLAKVVAGIASSQVLSAVGCLPIDRVRRSSLVLATLAEIRARESGQPTGEATPEAAVEPEAETSVRGSDAEVFDISHRTLTNPRMRTLLGIELAGMKRAILGRDYRSAIVHLALATEATVVDHALQRRDELGLEGDPEVWTYPDMLTALLGRELTHDESTVFGYLTTVPLVIRPSVQLSRPLVANRRSFDTAVTVLRRVFSELGVESALVG